MSWLSQPAKTWDKLSGAKDRRKRDKKALGQYEAGVGDALIDFETIMGQHLLDYQSRQQPSAGEREYADLLRTRMEKGALPVGQLTQQVGLRVGEFAQAGQAAVSGEFANIGLGGTAASASAVGRVQSKALQAIAEQSRAIQIENELSKIGAGDKIGGLGMRETDATRRFADMLLNAQTGVAGATFGTETNLAGTLLGGRQNMAAYSNDQMLLNMIANFISKPKPGSGDDDPQDSPWAG